MAQGKRGSLPRFLDTLRLDTSTLLYWGVLTLLLLTYVLLLYVMVVSTGFFLLGEDPESATPWWFNAIAFGVIVLGFLPVSRWLSVRINDLVYGEHDDPYSLIAGANRQLQNMTNPAVTLPMLAKEISNDLRLPYVAIETTGFEPALHYDAGKRPAGNHISRLPILYLEQPIGLLLTSPRKGARALSESDRQLLHDVAGQIGVALYAARLTAEVQNSREKLVMVREEERRRIRNDLHDGLGPTLSSLQLQLSAIRRLIHTNPDQAVEIVVEMHEDLKSATAEIRQLVYDLRPPMLDELGLVEALRNSFPQGTGVHFDLLTPDPLPHLSAAVEVAIYRIVNEAVHNVLKHSEASLCQITIDVAEDILTLLITDNGRGFPKGSSYGVGLQAMRERAEELGGSILVESREEGGTRLIIQLPEREP